MDKLTQYRSVIQTILSRYYDMTTAQTPSFSGFEVGERLAFDTDRD